jgi:hypothetical protein
VRIALADDVFAYAQMLTQPEYAFFDLRDAGTTAASIVVTYPVLFRLWVARDAHSSGRWQKVGDAPLPPPLRLPVLRFNQDPLEPRSIKLGYQGDGVPVTADECEGYERAAVWSAVHVEDRIRDRFAGTPNAWVALLRPRPPAGPPNRSLQRTKAGRRP